MPLSRISVGLAITFVVAPLAGCAFDPKPVPPPPPTPLAINDTPRNTILRFQGTYEQLDVALYAPLFTKDFRFTFSSQSDPTLVQQYGTTWGKDDETESTRHLFQGFTDEHGVQQPAATAISMMLPPLVDQDDPFHADSTEHYRVLAIPTLLLHIGLANDAGFEVSAPHTFYVVRGDAAVLDDGQDATASRWYIRRWDDLSSSLPAAQWLVTRASYR